MTDPKNIEAKANESHIVSDIKAALGIGNAREEKAQRTAEELKFQMDHNGKDYSQVAKEIKTVEKAVGDIKKEVAQFDKAADKQFDKDRVTRQEEHNKALGAIRKDFGAGNHMTGHQMKLAQDKFNEAEKAYKEAHDNKKTEFRLGLDDKLAKVLVKNAIGAKEWANAQSDPKDKNLVDLDDKTRKTALGMLNNFVENAAKLVGKLLGISEENEHVNVARPHAYNMLQPERSQQQSASPQQPQTARQQDAGFLKVKLDEKTEVFIDPKVAKGLGINHQTHPDAVAKLLKGNQALADNTITHKLDDKGQVTDISFGAKVNAVTTSSIRGNSFEIKAGELLSKKFEQGAGNIEIAPTKRPDINVAASAYNDLQPQQAKSQQHSASPQQQDSGFIKVKLDEKTEVFIDPKVAKGLGITAGMKEAEMQKILTDPKKQNEIAENTITHKLDDKGQVTDISFGAKVNAVTTSSIRGNSFEIKAGQLHSKPFEQGAGNIPITPTKHTEVSGPARETQQTPPPIAPQKSNEAQAAPETHAQAKQQSQENKPDQAAQAPLKPAEKTLRPDVAANPEKQKQQAPIRASDDLVVKPKTKVDEHNSTAGDLAMAKIPNFAANTRVASGHDVGAPSAPVHVQPAHTPPAKSR